MQEADVILASLAQADGSRKRRPCIVLRILPGYGDFLVCGVSTRLSQEIQGFDELILMSEADFPNSGLVNDSLIRLTFLSVVADHECLGVIGSITSERHQRLVTRLGNYIVETQETESVEQI
jgi:mRNA interferase MazF